MQKYSSINELDISLFKHIVAGAFSQMQRSCICRIREINTLISGEILFIDVIPGSTHQQLILSDNEREQLMSQLGAMHYLSLNESSWAKSLESIRRIQKCENSLYKGPFFISGLTEQGVDYSLTTHFLSVSFEDNTNFLWQNELGYYFPLSGKVVYGNKIGRTMGFPTINILPHDMRKLIPPMGVYIGLVKAKGKWHHAMINIGIRPTLDLRKVTIEAHLFDFTDEIYGDDVSLHFTGRIRDEMKFTSLDSLKLQLEKDKKVALSQLKKLPVTPDEQDEILILH